MAIAAPRVNGRRCRRSSHLLRQLLSALASSAHPVTLSRRTSANHVNEVVVVSNAALCFSRRHDCTSPFFAGRLRHGGHGRHLLCSHLRSAHSVATGKTACSLAACCRAWSHHAIDIGARIGMSIVQRVQGRLAPTFQQRNQGIRLLVRPSRANEIGKVPCRLRLHSRLFRHALVFLSRLGVRGRWPAGRTWTGLFARRSTLGIFGCRRSSGSAPRRARSVGSVERRWHHALSSRPARGTLTRSRRVAPVSWKRRNLRLYVYQPTTLSIQSRHERTGTSLTVSGVSVYLTMPSP